MTQVSVIIPCYLSSKTLARALDSVVNQTLLPSEVILIDDASPDNGETLKAIHNLVQKYTGTLNIKVVELAQNRGAAGARNAGWAVAREAYIAFLDSDDAWHPQKIEIQYHHMIQNPEVFISGHSSLIFDSKQNNSWPNLNYQPEIRLVTKFNTLILNPYATRTVMMRRETHYRFKEEMRYIEDYLLWMQIILSSLPSSYISAPLAATFKANYGEGGLSANLWKMERGELDAYLQVYREGKIGALTLFLLYLLSLIKYLRRFFIVNLNKITRII